MTDHGAGPAGAGARTSVLVFLGHGQDDEGWEERVRRGEANNPGPYGYAYARDRVDVAYATSRPEGPLGRTVRAGLKYLVGFDLVHAWDNRRAVRDADVVWTHTEKEHLALSALKLLGVLPTGKPVVAQSVWLWGWLPAARGPRRALTLRLLRLNQVHTVLAEDGARIGTRVLGRPVHVVPYGVTPAEPAGPRTPRPRPVVIAPGNDKDRDWETLGRAARLCPEVDFVVLSRRAAAQHLASLPNVQVRQAADHSAMEREYAACDAVVVPVRPNPHASGATTVLQAIGIERPVVATRVGGIELYGGETAFYCATGDAESLASAVREALERGDVEHCRRGREDMLARGLTEEDYALRHVLLTEDLLAGRPPRAAVTEDVRPRATR
ncbi:glycosyltransferase [Kineococcus gypseus]|uniref:glycosyltransferase n=1 Tax=Kineococcus gypseus TaxID=1637102 RepID=UPI003D7CD64D